jgi:D-psicose/D-tagatose/L-ribulose 3-epimerase
MNKIGFNVLAWSAGMSEEIFPILDRLKEIGYDGVELFVGSSDHNTYKKIGDHAQQLGLEVTSVMLLGAEENPIDPSTAIREKGLDKLKWGIDRSHDLQSQLICGPFHSAFTIFAKRAPEEEEYNRSAEILYQAGDYAAQAGIILAPEAVNRFECYLCNTMEQLSHLVNKVGHPSVMAMFDTHHANIEEKSFQNAIRTIAPILGHVHISENDRGTPGKGHVPFDEVFAELAAVDYKGWLTIEGFTRNDPDFANSIGVWREFSEPWEMATQGYNMIKEMCLKHGL